jgi:hypothetical protein
MKNRNVLTYEPVVQVHGLEQRFGGPAFVARLRVRRIVRRLNTVPVVNLQRRVA